MAVVPKIIAYIGPMFADKTNDLIRMYDKYSKKVSNVVAIKPDIDTRYTGTARLIRSHTKRTIPATLVAKDRLMEDFASKVREGSVVLIDEGQFFSNLMSACLHLKYNLKCRVYVACLSATATMEPWPEVVDLLTVADTKSDHYATACAKCGKPNAPFTQCKAAPGDSVVRIGGADLYESVCGDCHFGLQLSVVALRNKWGPKDAVPAKKLLQDE